ncbi:SGNH/GDSL hydrolase family protein [Streptomyces sp. XD-27]|uniref:SGNH/GDSL hydrolase family protein n=1 Tax=Streptomyces sp. XD-27 TaxID=3062779 RepID=UPI0026F41EC6|nr:SGNH/GDSL hydrolase family protein [Streptomyces sp. XD-27]WKX69318.1 SGNH/GDSL hydrolase family protein [Streptomyces sp. XD-27]
MASTARPGAPAAAAPRREGAARIQADQTITFSEFPLNTAISKQYQSRGIVFAGSGGGGTPFISQDGANPSSPVLSGSPQFHGGIQGAFVKKNGKPRTVSKFSLDVGYIDTPGTVAVTALDRKGKQIARKVVDRTGIVSVTLQAKGIASFQVDEVAGEAAGFAIDNVAYAQPEVLAALGDSYSSGEANPPYDPGTGSRTGCHRSAGGWPRLLGQNNQSFKRVKHIACSGATTAALNGRFKGEIPQLESLAKLKGTDEPAYVTMSMGGNDVGFAPILKDCYLHNCVRDGTVAQAAARIDALRTRLVSDYKRIQDTAPNATVVIVGYPRLFPNRSQDENCLWLADNERAGLNQLSIRLDRMLAGAARGAGVEYVSVLETMNRHELCSRRSWIYPINIYGGQQQAHPILPGQQAIEAVVRRRIADLG